MFGYGSQPPTSFDTTWTFVMPRGHSTNQHIQPPPASTPSNQPSLTHLGTQPHAPLMPVPAFPAPAWSAYPAPGYPTQHLALTPDTPVHPAALGAPPVIYPPSWAGSYVQHSFAAAYMPPQTPTSSHDHPPSIVTPAARLSASDQTTYSPLGLSAASRDFEPAESYMIRLDEDSANNTAAATSSPTPGLQIGMTSVYPPLPTGPDASPATTAPSEDSTDEEGDDYDGASITGGSALNFTAPPFAFSHPGAWYQRFADIDDEDSDEEDGDGNLMLASTALNYASPPFTFRCPDGWRYSFDIDDEATMPNIPPSHPHAGDQSLFGFALQYKEWRAQVDAADPIDSMSLEEELAAIIGDSPPLEEDQ